MNEDWRNELITKGAAIDALKEPDVRGDYDDFGVGQYTQWEDDTCAIKALPSAQPEIIRCRECKHYQFADNRAFGMPVKMCEWFGFEDVDDDDFCSRAERRQDE